MDAIDQEIHRQTAENLDALREEYLVQQEPGYQRKLSRLVDLYQAGMKKAGLGKYEDDADRLRTEGANRALQEIFDHDKSVTAAWEEHISQAEREEPADEGGPNPIRYEMAGQEATG